MVSARWSMAPSSAALLSLVCAAVYTNQLWMGNNWEEFLWDLFSLKEMVKNVRGKQENQNQTCPFVANLPA